MSNVPAPSSGPPDAPGSVPLLFEDRAAEEWLAELEQLLFHDSAFAAAVDAAVDAQVQELLDLEALARRWRMTGPKCDPVARRELERRAAERAAELSTSLAQARRIVKREALERSLFLLAEAPIHRTARRMACALLL